VGHVETRERRGLPQLKNPTLIQFGKGSTAIRKRIPRKTGALRGNNERERREVRGKKNYPALKNRHFLIICGKKHSKKVVPIHPVKKGTSETLKWENKTSRKQHPYSHIQKKPNCLIPNLLLLKKP